MITVYWLLESRDAGIVHQAYNTFSPHEWSVALCLKPTGNTKQRRRRQQPPVFVRIASFQRD